MSRSSLRTITNINIDGQALDAATQRQRLSFKVNCDSLSWILLRYYDNTNGDHFTRYYPKGGVMIAKHNGEYFEGWFGYDSETGTSAYTLGHDYTAVPIIFQNEPEEGHPENTGPGKYDVLLGSGRVQESASASTEVYIDKGITSIISPERYDDGSTIRLIGGCMLRISGVNTLIESYNKNTGKATLTSAITVTAGTPYDLISNYLECEPFFWYCRSDPEVTLTAQYVDGTINGTRYSGVRATGDYEQDEGVAMQWYQFSFLGEEGDRTFTYTFEDLFPLPFSSAVISGGKVKCNVTTQENKCAEFEQLPTAPTIDTTTVKATAAETAFERKVTITVTGGVSGAMMFLWRIETGRDPVLVRVTSTPSSLIDYTAESGKTYTYRVVEYSNGTIYFAECTCTVTGKRVKISQLAESTKSYHRRKFSTVSSMFFDISSEQNSTDRMIGSQLIGTQTGQPSVIYDDTDYDSGTLTVYADMLGSITAPVSNGLQRMNRLDSFFAYQGPFLIVDNAGMTRIVAISSVSREYDYKLGLTSYTIDWTEICKLGEAMI